MKRIWILAIALNLACGGSVIPNPGTPIRDVRLQVRGIDSTTARISVRRLAPGISITEARMALGRIRFRQGTDCASISSESSEDIEFEGPYVADLLSNTTVPDLGTQSIEVGSYCRIELRMEKVGDESLRIEGTRGDGTPFIAVLDVDSDFKLENSSGGFQVEEGTTPVDFFITFDLAAWLSGVNLDTAEVLSGEIRIDKDHNETILDQITENVKRSADLFEDQDGDGALEDSEREDDDSLGSGEDN